MIKRSFDYPLTTLPSELVGSFKAPILLIDLVGERVLLRGPPTFATTRPTI